MPQRRQGREKDPFFVRGGAAAPGGGGSAFKRLPPGASALPGARAEMQPESIGAKQGFTAARRRKQREKSGSKAVP